MCHRSSRCSQRSHGGFIGRYLKFSEACHEPMYPAMPHTGAIDKKLSRVLRSCSAAGSTGQLDPVKKYLVCINAHDGYPTISMCFSLIRQHLRLKPWLRNERAGGLYENWRIGIAVRRVNLRIGIVWKDRNVKNYFVLAGRQRLVSNVRKIRFTSPLLDPNRASFFQSFWSASAQLLSVQYQTKWFWTLIL